MKAALDTFEPPIVDRSMTLVLDRDQPWSDARLVVAETMIRKHLAALSTRLGGAGVA